MDYASLRQTNTDTSVDNISVCEEAVWTSINDSLDLFQAVKLWYASDRVLSDFIDEHPFRTATKRILATTAFLKIMEAVIADGQ